VCVRPNGRYYRGGTRRANDSNVDAVNNWVAIPDSQAFSLDVQRPYLSLGFSPLERL